LRVDVAPLVGKSEAKLLLAALPLPLAPEAGDDVLEVDVEVVLVPSGIGMSAELERVVGQGIEVGVNVSLEYTVVVEGAKDVDAGLVEGVGVEVRVDAVPEDVPSVPLLAWMLV
jgi:hypothetical protein